MFTQYLTDKNQDSFCAIEKFTVKAIVPGIYSYNMTQSGMVFSRETLPSDRIYLDPDQEDLKNRLMEFVASRARYAELGFSHKRGYLLYGPPGAGKTTVLRSIVKDIVALNGIIIKLGYLEEFPTAIQAVREIEGNEKTIMVVCEDVEEKSDGILTNVMDGMMSLDNVFFVMTTNNIARVSGRIKNRPSRIDELLFVDYPSDEARRIYISNVINSVKTPDPGFNIDTWIKLTDGLSIAHIKELMIQVFVYRADCSELLEKFKAQCKKNLELYGPDSIDSEDLKQHSEELLPTPMFARSAHSESATKFEENRFR
jgi:SpoVK/Ycf46/Vps4 family AAA+-type ATPase